MKTPPEKASAVQSPFDEWTKAVAHGLTRRKSLQLLGGGLSGALLALGLPKSWAGPTPAPTPSPTKSKGCGTICAPLAPPASTQQQQQQQQQQRQQQTAFESCKDACEDCKSCQGTPSLTTTNALVCTNATPCRSASGLACCEPDQNCCGVVCCDVDFFDCCAGTCLTRCPAGTERDPSTCKCVAVPTLFSYTCSCPDGHTAHSPCEFGTLAVCNSFAANNCNFFCSIHGGGSGNPSCSGCA